DDAALTSHAAAVARDVAALSEDAAALPRDDAALPRDDAALAARLRLVVNRLARQMRSHAEAGLSPSLASALVTIDLKGPMTLGQLAACERVTPPSITRMIGTLERRGLVRREADPTDRRVAHVSLTPEGRRTVQRNRSRKTALLSKRLRRLSDAEVATLHEALPLLEGLLEEDR
ncbi:MAG TPA: MarR family transcriptional regulator, partial [Thermoleophilia bacterium]|nr:MarR family transcriptional regulator [Thermoleophilia bacterium]